MRDTPELAAIFSAFGPVKGHLAELFHSGPSIDHFVKNEQRYRISQLNIPSKRIHHDHVHVAVERGTFLTPQGGGHSAPAPSRRPARLS